MGEGIMRYLGGRWTEAQRKTAEAGQGQYRPIKGNLFNVTYNIGQWNPWNMPVGKGLTALAQSVMLLGEPAVVTERIIGNTTYKQLEEELEVGTDPVKQQAWQAAIGVTWSGTESVRNAYKDALALSEAGQLDATNAELVQARHGRWVNEILGQILIDPLNLLAGGGKAVAQMGRLKQAQKLMVVPDVVKGTNLLRPSTEIVDDLSKLATRRGQFAEAERFFDKGLALINPRHQAAVKSRVSERVAQIMDFGGRTIEKRVLATLDEMGIRKGMPKFDDDYMKMAGDNFQAYAVEMAKMASDNPDDVANAAKTLERMGFGTVPQSTYGRRTGLVIKKLIGDDKQKGFYTIMQEIKEAGGTAEEVATRWSRRVAEVFDEIIEVPKWERGPVQRAARGILKAEKPITDFYAKLFMGMSLGFPMRNAADNVASMVALHWSPFKPAGQALAKNADMIVQGAQRGIGAVGEVIEGATPMTFGLKIGQSIEKRGARLIAYQFYDDAVRRLTPAAVKEVEKLVPAGTDPHLAKSFSKAVKMALGGGQEDILKLENEVNAILRAGGPEAAIAAVPPSGPTSRFLRDLWRQPSNTLIDQMQGTGDDLWYKAMEVLDRADTPEEAIEMVRKLQLELGEHIGKVANEAPNPGHVMGTPAGDAIHQLASGSAEVGAHTLEELAADLGRAQVALERSRGLAYRSVLNSSQPEQWTINIKQAEDQYIAAMRGIRQGQVGEYARLIAGEIDEAEYVKRVFSSYARIKSTLDYDYRRILGEAIMPVEPLDDLATLRSTLVKLGQQAGHPSAHIRGWKPVGVGETHTAYKMGRAVPDRHFHKLLQELTGRPDIRHITDLTPDELMQGINHFRNERGFAATTADDILAQAQKDFRKAQEIPFVDPMEAPAMTAIPPERVGLTGPAVQPRDIGQWKGVYHVTDDGMPIFEDIDTVTNARWKPRYEVDDPSQWTAVSFNRMPDGIIKATRGRAHIPADKMFHATVDPNTGRVVNLQFAGAIGEDTPLSKIQAYADDLVRSGVSPDTPIDKTGITGVLAKDLPEDLKKLGDLTTPDLDMAAYYLDNTGQKVYTVHPEGHTGEMSYIEFMASLEDDMANLVSKGDDEINMAVASYRQAVAGEMPLDPSPTLIDAAATGGAHSIGLLDGLIDEISEFAKLPAPPVARAGDVAETADNWGRALARLRGIHHETHLMASEAGRRARDMALLDYSDRRYLDPLIKTIFPWGYWHSRKVPNWATSLMLNPPAVAHYSNLKRELREHNNNDPRVPAWAKDHITIRPPGYPGALHYNLDASVNAVGTMFDDFDDPDQERSTLGKILQMVGMGGPAPHPLYMAAYAAERGLAGDEAGMRSYGYLAGVTKGFAALTGKTLEPWLWIKDPKTGKRKPWTGGSKWDIEKAVRYLGYQEGTGEVPHEAAVLGTATHAGKAYENSLTTILTQYRRVPVLASLVFGLRVTPRQDWEVELADWGAKFGAAKEAENEALQQQILDENPWLGSVWMSYDNETTRTKALGWDVLDRIPPGISRDQKQKLLNQVGISDVMVTAFYATDGEMSDWDQNDVRQFQRGLIQMGEILGTPDVAELKEWGAARKAVGAVYDELEAKYPDIQETQAVYFQLKETGQDDKAKELVQETRLGAYWADLNKMILADPLLVKYYASAEDVDRAAKALMHEQAEVQWPGVHNLQTKYYEIDPDDKVSKRRYRVANPDLVAYWGWKDDTVKLNQEMLAEQRRTAGWGIEAPRVTDYIVEGKPTITQRALLNTIEDMKVELDMPPPPLPEIESKASPADKQFYRALDNLYAIVWETYPDAPEWEKTYEQIKYVHGEETAKLYAQDIGLYDYWGELNVKRTRNPRLLERMDDGQIERASKNIMYRRAEERWPGIFDAQTGFYAIPESDKGSRRAYLDAHPQLRAYWDWKKGAAADFQRQLMDRRRDVRQQRVGGTQ
jgi:hypothetical protein